MIRGSTELVAIIGSPIAQVKSPENFNAWFAEQDKDLAMIAIDMQEQALDGFLAALRGWNNLRGCVVTVPYKQVLATRLDAVSERSAALRSVNVIRREADGRLVGDIVDGEGFLNAARRHGFDPAGKRALVIGAGGVGSAIAYSLCQGGVIQLALSDLGAERVESLCSLLRRDFPEVDISGEYQSLGNLDLVVNASPVGMDDSRLLKNVGEAAEARQKRSKKRSLRGVNEHFEIVFNAASATQVVFQQPDSGELPLPAQVLETLQAHTLVADVVTRPEITPLLALARRLGCRVQTGPEMAYAQLGNLGHFMGVTPLEI